MYKYFQTFYSKRNWKKNHFFLDNIKVIALLYYDANYLKKNKCCFNVGLIDAKVLLTPLDWLWNRNSEGGKYEISTY